MTLAAGDPAGSADQQAVSALILRERQSRDRGWWDDMAACFSADAMIDMSWFRGPAAEFIRQTSERSTDGAWGRHRLAPPAVRVNGDRAWGEVTLGIEFQADVNGVAADLVSHCRSQYRARCVDGIWRLASITSVYERDTLTPAVPGTVLPVDPAEFAHFRASYRCLAWYFNRRGTPLPDDLLGDDRPEPVARQYAREETWLTAQNA